MKSFVQNVVGNSEDAYDGNLIHYFRLVFNSSKSDNPYHNFRHYMHVMCNVYKALLYYSYNLTPEKRREFRAALIAAMMHDFGHSGRKEDDKDQVQRAIRGVRENILEEDMDLLPLIETLISATEYPHKEKELTLLEQIMRDADLTQAFDVSWMQQILFGLGKEWEISPLVMLEKQVSFLNIIQFYTDWARQSFEVDRQDRIEEVERYIEWLS